jgi:peptide chain release factor 2
MIMKEIKSHKKWISSYMNAKSHLDDLEVLLEFFDAGEATEEELDAKYNECIKLTEDIEFFSTLNKPEDELSCLVEINSGAAHRGLRLVCNAVQNISDVGREKWFQSHGCK